MDANATNEEDATHRRIIKTLERMLTERETPQATNEATRRDVDYTWCQATGLSGSNLGGIDAPGRSTMRLHRTYKSLAMFCSRGVDKSATN